MTSQASINSRKGTVKVAIVGGGFGGLCTAIKLQEAGIQDYLLLEKAEQVGGTWRENTYPGAACDVQSHMYSFSFAPNPDWSQRYSGWQEIQDYILRTTQLYGVEKKTRFNSEVVGAHFDPATALWTLNLKGGDVVYCQHWVLATGPLHVPSIPDFPGLENFKGKVIHSSRWDHDYDMSDKRVVSIGTGASAIQYVPEVAKQAKDLTVVQRTPGWIIPRDERRYSALSKMLYRRFPALRKLHRARLYWSNESRVLPIFNPTMAKALGKLCEVFIRAQVKDKETAKKLVPDFTFGCKRVLISNRYYPTFNRDNVSLVTEGVQEIRENSIVFKDGTEKPMDCLLLGTGFVVDPRIYMKDFEITGLPGRRLQDDWRDASEAYMGVSISGYPNMHMLVGPNTGLGHNSIIFMIECQVRYIIDGIQKMDRKGARFMDVKPEVMAEFNERMQQNLDGTVWQMGGCSSWYQQDDGRNVALWPHGTWLYWVKTRQLKADDYTWQTAPVLTAVSAEA